MVRLFPVMQCPAGRPFRSARARLPMRRRRGIAERAGAPLELAVEALDGVSGCSFVRSWGSVRLVPQASELGQLAAELVGELSPLHSCGHRIVPGKTLAMKEFRRAAASWRHAPAHQVHATALPVPEHAAHRKGTVRYARFGAGTSAAL